MRQSTTRHPTPQKEADVGSTLTRLRSTSDRVLPPRGLPRLLCVQTFIWSLGAGAFLAGEAVFFVRYVDLSVNEVSTGLSIAGVVAILANLPMGRWVDRIGAHKAWAITAFCEAVCIASYLVVQNWWAFVAVLAVLATNNVAGSSARNAYTFNALAESERLATLATVRSVLNIGFALGGGFAAVVLAVDDTRMLAILPIATALVFLFNSLWLARLPDEARHTAVDADRANTRDDREEADPDEKSTPARSADSSGTKAPSALADRPFFKLAVARGGLATMEALLNVVFPLFVVSTTDAPASIVGIMFAVNTAAVIFLQVPASRLVGSVAAARKFLLLGSILIAASCATLAGTTPSTSVAGDVMFVAAAYVLLTIGELFVSPAEWMVFGAFTSRDTRGQYSSVWTLGAQLMRVAALPVYTVAVTNSPALAWLLLAAIFCGFGVATAKLVSAISDRGGTHT